MALLNTERVLFESTLSATPAYRISTFEHEGSRRVILRCWEALASEGRHEFQASNMNLKESSLPGLVAALGKCQKALEAI